MADTPLGNRQHALEDAFYREDTETYRAELELREQEESALEDLASASGIGDEALLRRLAALGIRADTLAALTLIPLIEVAWADGKMDASEREAVLFGAESTGIPRESPSHGLLRIWIEDQPAPDLVDAWSEFIRTLCRELSDEQRARLERNILDRAREVAEAAGGFLGLGPKVSKQERAVLESLARAFQR
jgi:tellurite resistance protein